MHFAKDKIEWLEYDLLKNFPQLSHGVFLRHGGTSEGSFASLNASDSVGDHPDNVKANRDLLLESSGLSKLIFLKLRHGSNVFHLKAENEKIPEADAAFTQEKNIGLVVTHADCQGALFYDPENEAIGICHCGWKGSVQNVYANLVNAMKAEIGTEPSNLLVCISPSLGPDHAEFVNYKKELPEDFWSFQTSPNLFDFWAISRKQLNGLGIPEKKY